MRAASGALIAYLAANRVAHRADLVTLTTLGGTVYQWTTFDSDLTVSAITYSTAGTNGPLVQRGPYTQNARLAVDTLDLVLIGGTFSIGGKTLGLNAAQGYFDGARVRIDHLIMPNPGDVSLGSVGSFFEGRVAQAEPQGARVNLRLKSELEVLGVQMLPRFNIQPPCGNALYDANCGLVKATFTLTGTVSSSTAQAITTATPALTAKAAGYFNLGLLKFTGGALAGTSRAVKAWSGTVFILALALPAAPSAGDAFSVYPGCDHTLTTCLTTFANLGQFRGYPHVPTSEGGA